MYQIRPYQDTDLPHILRLWNESVDAGEVVFYPATEAYLNMRIFDAPHDVKPFTFVAEDNGHVAGCVIGVCQKTFLPKQTHENTPGYLVAIFVEKGCRRKGIGKQLMGALEDAFRANGKKTIAMTSVSPIDLEWRIPNTPGHDHNNVPGVDKECDGYPFLSALGFQDTIREVAMYLDLSKYQEPSFVKEKQQKLREEGIQTGRYDVSLHYDFDRMCTRVGSEYWRKVLQDETAKENPRPILAATTPDGYIVGFTGPVDRQESGRGWFTGICTDPEYEGRGIASVLFNLLMQEFIQVGADFSTLFTGEENWAQKVYRRAGFDVVRTFSYMSKPL